MKKHNSRGGHTQKIDKTGTKENLRNKISVVCEEIKRADKDLRNGINVQSAGHVRVPLPSYSTASYSQPSARPDSRANMARRSFSFRVNKIFYAHLISWRDSYLDLGFSRQECCSRDVREFCVVLCTHTMCQFMDFFLYITVDSGGKC